MGVRPVLQKQAARNSARSRSGTLWNERRQHGTHRLLGPPKPTFFSSGLILNCVTPLPTPRPRSMMSSCSMARISARAPEARAKASVRLSQSRGTDGERTVLGQRAMGCGWPPAPAARPGMAPVGPCAHGMFVDGDACVPVLRLQHALQLCPQEKKLELSGQ